MKREDLKDTDRLWQYQGVYEFGALLSDDLTLQDAEEKSGRFGELTHVLRLKPDPP